MIDVIIGIVGFAIGCYAFYRVMGYAAAPPLRASIVRRAPTHQAKQTMVDRTLEDRPPTRPDRPRTKASTPASSIDDDRMVSTTPSGIETMDVVVANTLYDYATHSAPSFDTSPSYDPGPSCVDTVSGGDSGGSCDGGGFE